MEQKCSRDHCKCGLGKMMFQVGGVSVRAVEIVRWLRDKQAGSCVGVISKQALQRSWWVGVLLSFLLYSHMALGRLSRKPLKSHVSSAVLEDMDFAEKHHGAFAFRESSGQLCMLGRGHFCTSSVQWSWWCSLTFVLVEKERSFRRLEAWNSASGSSV